MSSGRTPVPDLPRLPVYLDNHATTPVDPRVLEAMLPYLTSKFGNAASHSHKFGWEAEQAVESARRQIAALIGAAPQEIAFTSGATESNNLGIKGIAEAYCDKGNHVITTVTEPKPVLDTCKHLERLGCSVTYLSVRSDGLVALDQLERAVTSKTILVSIMAANNETGVLQPIEQIGELCRERSVFFHSDAVQALGKVPLDIQKMPPDLFSRPSHKPHAPKACGALFVRIRQPTARIAPMID